MTFSRLRRPLAILLPLGTLAGAIGGLAYGPHYHATASFVPQTSQSLQLPAGLAGLAGSFGFSLGAQSGISPEFYAALMASDGFLRQIVEEPFEMSDGGSSTLVEVLEAKGNDPQQRAMDAVRDVRRKVARVTFDRNTGIVRVRAKTRDPALSVALAKRYLELVNDFNIERLQSEARAERGFLEVQVDSARGALRESEDRLRAFHEENRVLTGAPELLLEEQRLNRIVATNQQLFLSLQQAYQEARIREVQDTPVITVLEDPANTLEWKKAPWLVGAGLGALGGLGLALALLIWQEQKRRFPTEPRSR